MNSNVIIFIVGPTAVGKSEAAFHLAQSIHGEIVSCDSMQVYKEINIVNNKPPQDILKAVAHHLVNIISIEEEFHVARFNQLALAAIQEIHGRGHIPIIVGGSGLYMEILLDGIFEGGAKDEALRGDLKQQARQYGNQFLYDKLKAEDGKAAEKIHPNDVRRVVRALEVRAIEKMPISQLRRQREGIWGKYDIRLFVLNMERQDLYERVDRRVEKMIEAGLVEEIERLKDARWSPTAGKIIGVQEVRGFFNQEYDLETVKERMKLNTRHLAKRQLTWFRRDDRLEWIMLPPDRTPEGIAEKIYHQWKQGE